MPGVPQEHPFELSDNWSLDELKYFWDGLITETVICPFGDGLSAEDAAKRMNAQFPNRVNKFTAEVLGKILAWVYKDAFLFGFIQLILDWRNKLQGDH
jgi:hypothetical protein